MEVILLERIGKLGQMGDVVRVKDGFARNFLLPRGKALRATADNKSKFEGMKAELQTRNLELKGEAGKLAAKVDGKTYRGDPPGERNRPVVRLGVDRATSPACSRPTAPRSTARRSCSMRRSSRSASTRCRWRCIRKSRRRSPSSSRAAQAEAERIARGEDVTVRREEAEEEAAAALASRGSLLRAGSGQGAARRR